MNTMLCVYAYSPVAPEAHQPLPEAGPPEARQLAGQVQPKADQLLAEAVLKGNIWYTSISYEASKTTKDTLGIQQNLH